MLVEVRLLGSVELRTAGGRLVVVGSAQRQLVLAALAVDAGRAVAMETLIDRVWGEHPPAQVRAGLYTRISHLRGVLAAADPVRAPAAADSENRVEVSSGLVLTPGGYVLRVDASQVDLLRFRRLVTDAHRQDRSDPDRLALLAEALGLWRGTSLAGLSGDWVEQARRSWELERLDAALTWARLTLRVGQAAQVIPTLRQLTDRHPHSEPPAVLLVRALIGEGRVAEAAEVCQTVSRRLVADLGVQPGHELRSVQQAVLGGQPLPPLTPPRPPAVAAVIPAQLPSDIPGFAGRIEHLARLDALLTTAAAEVPTAAVITAVSGTAGVGKTALAVHWAHRVADRFPDGQLYVNLRGFHPTGQVMDPATAVRGFLDALGVPAQRIPADPDAQTGLYRSLIAGKRVLVVLDNARDADQARPLLPGARTALALVTSRNALTDLTADGAHPIPLDLLTDTEAPELLQRRLGTARVAAEPAAVERIITACARLPLALALIAARAATNPGFRLAALAGELAAAGQSPPDGRDVIGQVRAVFSWSYRALSPDAACLFRLLGLHPGPDTSAPAAASLAAMPAVKTSSLLADLVRAGLLSEPLPGRYGFHDLLRAYATHLTHTEDTDQERDAATVRLLDHYAHTAHTATRHLDPACDPIPVPLTPSASGAVAEQLGDHDTALAWLDAEWPVLLAAQQQAADTGRDTHTCQLAWALDTALHRRGRWHEEASAWQTALPAAGRLPHPAAASAHRTLGQAATMLGDHERAHTHLHRALDLHTEAGEPVGQAHTHHALGYLWERRGQPEQALDHAQQALTLYQGAGHRRGHALALNGVGWDHALLGDHTSALTHCQQALTLFQQLGDRAGQADTWDSLGYAHHHLGHHTHAADSYTHARTLYRDLGDHYYEATTLTRLGDTHHAAGHPEAARAAWTTALTILTDLDHPDTDTVRAKLAALDQQPPRTEPDSTPIVHDGKEPPAARADPAAAAGPAR